MASLTVTFVRITDFLGLLSDTHVYRGAEYTAAHENTDCHCTCLWTVHHRTLQVFTDTKWFTSCVFLWTYKFFDMLIFQQIIHLAILSLFLWRCLHSSRVSHPLRFPVSVSLLSLSWPELAGVHWIPVHRRTQTPNTGKITKRNEVFMFNFKSRHLILLL